MLLASDVSVRHGAAAENICIVDNPFLQFLKN